MNLNDYENNRKYMKDYIILQTDWGIQKNESHAPNH